ncbi:MAG: diacylglycerol kinase family protein [Victivallales bacterium]
MNKIKVICFLNPLSCDGKSVERWKEVECIFKELDIIYGLVSFEGDLSVKIQEVLKAGVPDPTTIVGVGGDGTHNALINGMMKFKESNPGAYIPSYAIIPFGTGNNIAKSFSMSPMENLIFNDIRRAVISTVWGADYKLDLGRIGDRYFADGFACGIDAGILKGRDKDKGFLRKIPFLFWMVRGYLIYLYNVIKNIFGYRSVKGEIEIDGVKKYSGKILNIIINNTRIYAGEFDLTDTAYANDGRLDILISKGLANYLRRYLLSHRHFPRKIRKLGSYGEDSVYHIKGKVFKIKFDRPVPAQVDGEQIPDASEFNIKIFPSAIILKIPVEPA